MLHMGEVAGKARLIESELPVDVLSRDAAIEMSFKPRLAYYARCRELGIVAPKKFYDPKIRSIHPWLARRPRSIARALNLAALLPEDFKDEFLALLGFTHDKLRGSVEKGYPPLISYTTPETDTLNLENEVVLDPMAGGGTIPLESVILGVKTIACEYNPVAFLILKATVEFPAKYGVELYQRVRREVLSLITYARERLQVFYSWDAEGCIILRQVLRNGKVVPLATRIPLTSNKFVSLEESEVKILRGTSAMVSRRDLLPLWMQEHRRLMEKGDGELLDILHKCLVVQTKEGFRLASELDQRLLREAFEEYQKIKPPLPDIPLPADNGVFRDLLPLGKYTHLFNPRQALALGLAIKFVRERVRELVEKEGEFGAAIGLYLALGVDRLADFNSIITTWNSNQGTVRDSIGSYYKYRKFRLEGIYAEAIVPFKTLEWIFEPNAVDETAGGICPILKELCERLEGKGSKVKVQLRNVLELSRSFNEKVSVINVDPPYYDQHVYSDFSEFFWPLLKVSLSDALPLLFRENYLSSWSPESWRVPRESEVVSRGLKDRSFEAKFKKALTEMKKVLRDDGLLVVWFSHRKLEAWKAVVNAIREAGFKLTNILPLVSEHPTRSITKGGESGFSHVLILVARKSDSAFPINREELKRRVLEQAKRARIHPSAEVRYEELKVISYAVDLASSSCAEGGGT